MLRICSQKYSVSRDSFRDAYAHNDSYELNSSREDTFSLTSDFEYEGLRVSFAHYVQRMQEKADAANRKRVEGKEISEEEEKAAGFDSKVLWANIRRTIALAMLSGEEILTKAVASLVKQRFLFLDIDSKYFDC